MRFLDRRNWSLALGAGILASIAVLPQARAELVFDSELQPNGVAPMEERETARQVLSSSQKAHATLQAASAGADSAVQGATVEVQNMSKSELLRRERLRAELKNEDILQERLEELRLRDEKRRTDEVLGHAPQPELALAAPMKEEIVAAPVTDRPGQPTVAPAGVMASPVSDQVAVSRASAESSTEDKLVFSVMPRGGLSGMVNTNGLDVQGRYSAGLGIALGVSDNLTFEIGYAFSEYGVSLPWSNPYAQNFMATSGIYNPSFPTLAMKQNVFDAGLRIYLLGPDSRLRPFIGAGAGYAKSFLNSDSRLQDLSGQFGYRNPDYDVSSFLGILSAGLDVRLTKNISVGALFKYSAVLTARENQGLPYGYFTNGLYSPVGYGLNYMNPMVERDKQVAGTSLSRSGFYTIMGGVNFSF